jgi:hypothetical protein
MWNNAVQEVEAMKRGREGTMHQYRSSKASLALSG